ncbi:unnamed protein product [Sordaria macrospora k-hell]|uniref:WGS project CABT00000000 data, contig 2.3 n=1 Tax=Sordaria macrospora (strain ATCC MYA-333 / DSM 997 / K(L3346) / K-hell) TaxID=771870 RepID=F7VPA8_SORMK|nr:uncharacterized protein SMAC_02343 [Sordaria macrospora k-hell]CCC07336.1 unnamed protein product [Sordaria macrospora k-hell]
MASTDVTMADAPSGRPDRRSIASPPPGQSQSQSKRDKRRQMLAERIATLSEKWSKERDQTFREQLQKIQIDTSLVMRVDPYVDRPLDSFEEDQRRLNQLNGTDPDGVPRSLLDMAGPKFAKWMEKVQDLAEQRDYALTKYKFDYEKKIAEYLNTHAYKTELANREHKALASTLRDRLINIITSKKYRLNKEKEALEIADASALLLHPNQFSITNPASPGGTHGKRATRLRREMEDTIGMDGKKRKRNMNDDDGSPAPQRRALDPNSTTPLWQTDRLVQRKTTGPIYSIDKLFTDKELSMTYNQSALAAHKYILTHKPRFDDYGRPISSPEGSVSGSGDLDDPDSELMGLEMLANFDFPGNLERLTSSQDPKQPPAFPSQYVKGHAKQSDFNTPAALASDDVSGDLMVMHALKQYDQLNGMGANLQTEHGSMKLLQSVSLPIKDRRFVSFVQGERPSENELRERLGLPPIKAPVEPERSEPTNGLGLGTPSKGGRSGTPSHHASPAKALGGVSMSRQSSANGGVAMSRTSSRKGRGGRGG